MVIEFFEVPNGYIFNRANKVNNLTDLYFWGRNDGAQDLQALNPGMYWTSANIVYYPGNIFSVKVPNVGLCELVHIEIRHVTDNATKAVQQGSWGLGLQIPIIGQSNCPEVASITSGTSTAPGICRLYKRGDRYDPEGNTETVIMSPQNYPAISAAMTKINAVRADIPVMFLMMGYDGSDLAQWNGENFSYGTINQLPYLKAHYDHYRENCFQGPEMAVWLGGEAEMLQGISKAIIKNRLGDLHRNLLKLFRRSANEFTFILTLPSSTVNQNSYYSSVTPQQITNVRSAIAEYANDNIGVVIGGDRASVQLADYVHLARNPAGAGAHGTVIGNTIAGLV